MNDSPRTVTSGDLQLSPIASCGSRFHAKSNHVAMLSSTDDELDDDGIHHPRSLILQLASLVGSMCSAFLVKMPMDPPIQDLSQQEDNNSNKRDDAKNANDEPYSLSPVREAVDVEVANSMAQVLLLLLQTSHAMSLSLQTVICHKMELNARKYPVELCKGKSGKYTEYSGVTGITKTEGQSIQKNNKDGKAMGETIPSFLDSTDDLTLKIRSFAMARQWSRYHKPRNLVLALLGELGELAELFQWKGDHDGLDSIKDADMDKIGQELADVTIYLLRLADTCNVDLKARATLLLTEQEK